jgi:hypothetical protein
LACALASPRYHSVSFSSMSIDCHPTGKPLAQVVPPNWGEVAPAGELALVTRFLLETSVVTFPAGHFSRWEHARGVSESLIIWTAEEQIVVEGRDLGPIRAALDLGKLCEVRLNYVRHVGATPGPQVRRIVVEPRAGGVG